MRHLAAAAALLLAACVHRPSAKALKTAEIHHDLAAEAMQKGAPQDALREYDQALEADPAMPEAHNGRGLVLEYGFGRSKEAEAEYRRALEVRPAYPEAHNNLGQLLARTGRYEEALREYDEALASAFYREPWNARLNKALTLYQMGRKDDGLAELRGCLAAAPRFCDARRELGRILLGEGKIKQAVEELATGVRDCDRRWDLHLLLAQARMKDRDVAGARTSYERCLELAKATPGGDECRRALELLQ